MRLLTELPEMIPLRRHLQTIVWLGLCVISPNPALAFEQAVPRYALVIGNAGYSYSPLKNALNDASDIAFALAKLDYQVTLERDLEHDDFLGVIKKFYAQIQSQDAISIFYYAGHALQIDSINYLIPVKSPIVDRSTLEAKSFSLDKLLFVIRESRGEQNIIILDACRSNPFRDQGEAGTQISGIRELAGGLAPMDAPANTLVAYATEPGNVSSDGTGRNGTYTRALLEYISESIPAEELFKKVRKDVMNATRNQQIPWEHSSLTKEFYFGPPVNEEITDIISF